MERLLGVAVASLSSGAQPIGWSGVLWDMFGCGPLLRHGLLLLLLQLCSESSGAGMCGALPKTQGGLLFYFLRKMGTGFRDLIGSISRLEDSKHFWNKFSFGPLADLASSITVGFSLSLYSSADPMLLYYHRESG